jgi:hypothetical protein
VEVSWRVIRAVEPDHNAVELADPRHSADGIWRPRSGHWALQPVEQSTAAHIDKDARRIEGAVRRRLTGCLRRSTDDMLRLKRVPFVTEFGGVRVFRTPHSVSTTINACVSKQSHTPEPYVVTLEPGPGRTRHPRRRDS